MTLLTRQTLYGAVVAAIHCGVDKGINLFVKFCHAARLRQLMQPDNEQHNPHNGSHKSKETHKVTDTPWRRVARLDSETNLVR